MLQEAIGTREINATSLLKYFDPLTKWLEEQTVNETLGWPDLDWVPPVPEGYPDDIDAELQTSTLERIWMRFYVSDGMVSHLNGLIYLVINEAGSIGGWVDLESVSENQTVTFYW